LIATFCRHGTQLESCPICHVSVENARREGGQRRAPGRGTQKDPTRAKRARAPIAGRGGRLTIRHETRAADDGFRSALAPGLRSSADAERLADALARSSARLASLAADPPGLYAEVASEADAEEASWLALLIVLVGPLEGVEDPFAAIAELRTRWSSGLLPDLADAQRGPRSSLDPGRAADTLLAYRRWAERAGSQAAGFSAEASWSETQRFERVFERLALPAFDRRARFDLLVTLGALGRYPLRAASLLLVEDDAVNRAAKRVFGIGDRLTLERRSRELAAACDLQIAAFDLALENWAAHGQLELGVRTAPDPDARERTRAALGL
jgi:hypothetical protein